MKKSKTAVLLSALLCPGAGHIYLKQYVSGAMLLGATLYVLYVLLSHAVTKALEITDQIVNGKIVTDVLLIREMIRNQTTVAEAQQLTMATTVLVIVWLIGIIDSYRVGKKHEGVLDSEK